MMRVRRPPVRLDDGIAFPDPRDHGRLVAVGGDLSEARLIAAYENGIFPWFDEGQEPLWWSPDPRAVIDEVHVSRSLARVLRRAPFRVTQNTQFDRVMRECGAQRDEGTWIHDAMLVAYAALHRAGYARSVEVWRGDELVGGLYGVTIGRLFAAESMFHRATNASKVALVHAVRSWKAEGGTLFDVQFETRHLTSMGATQIPRSAYVARVRDACARDRGAPRP